MTRLTTTVFSIATISTMLLATARAESPERGETLFNAHCAICHGIGGTGGRGPDLRMQPFVRVRTDVELMTAIRLGLKGTEMPGAWALDRDDAHLVAEYVRGLAKASRESLRGNPDRGRSLYDLADCSQCHIVAGAGRGLGPELSAIGSSRGAEHLRRAVARPGDDVARDYLFVQVQTADGVPVEGIRLNEDAFSLQLRDFEGNLHSYRKDALRSYRALQGRSLMPEYAARFTAADLDDLVAYLTTLTRPE
jgi:putative heme-binding domain-containing protein